MKLAALLDDPRIRFLLAGGSAALLNWLVRFPLSLLFSYTAAVLMAMAIGMAYGFVIYRGWVFISPVARSLPVQIRDFLLVNAGGAGVTVLVAVLVLSAMSGLSLPQAVAEGFSHAVGIAAGAFVNYLGHKHVTFRRPTAS